MALKGWRLKLLVAMRIQRATRVVGVDKLTLYRMTAEPQRYSGLAEGLKDLPVPLTLKVGRQVLPVPQDLDTLCGNITYGQRMWFAEQEQWDTGLIVRLLAGYYQPLYTKMPWQETAALLFRNKVIHLLAKDVYPIANHFTQLMEQLVERERKLLHRTPTAEEKAAGIERLTRFADLTAVLFLQDSFKCTVDAVMGLPYNDCLVRFMLAKEQGEYQDRLTAVYREKNKSKYKQA